MSAVSPRRGGAVLPVVEVGEGPGNSNITTIGDGQYCTVLYRTTLQHTALHLTTLHHATLDYTTLEYTILHYT